MNIIDQFKEFISEDDDRKKLEIIKMTYENMVEDEEEDFLLSAFNSHGFRE